jgi:hypothetical protein
VREFREHGSVRGALSNERPYREPSASPLEMTQPIEPAPPVTILILDTGHPLNIGHCNGSRTRASYS